MLRIRGTRLCASRPSKQRISTKNTKRSMESSQSGKTHLVLQAKKRIFRSFTSLWASSFSDRLVLVQAAWILATMTHPSTLRCLLSSFRALCNRRDNLNFKKSAATWRTFKFINLQSQIDRQARRSSQLKLRLSRRALPSHSQSQWPRFPSHSASLCSVHP